VPAPELGPRAREIAVEARALLNERGPEALTMRAVAERLGIQAPSLYKHFASKEALEAAVVTLALEDFAERFEAAAAAPNGDRLGALAGAYRAYAHAMPHEYRLVNDRPLPRDLLPEGLEARAAAPLLRAVGTLERARSAWAFAHGMVSLELNGRFPPDADLEAAWGDGIRALRRVPRPT
jgi:AcrR family transcriptional regulator